MRDRVERAGVQAICKRVIHQEGGHEQQPRIVHVAEAVALQRAQIVRVAQLGAQRFEDCPVAIAARDAELALEMTPEIVLHAVVVEQRVVTIEQKHDVIPRFHP